MASAIVGALRVLLTLDSAEFETGMKSVSSSAKAWSGSLSDIGKQATAVGSALTKTLTLPLAGLGIAAVKAASDFESSFAGVRKTVDATEPEFAALAQGLRDMAKEIPTNVNDLNRVAEAAGQLGIKKGDILAFTRTMADLGVTTNLTADEAATATAQIQNIFGAAGKDVDRFGATLVALGNAGASTEKDIIQMGLRIAGAGHQVGLTQAQVLAFASALSSVGINAEAGGSAISRVFLKINDAVAKGGSGLAEFARVSGMSAGEFKVAWEKDAATATTAFISGLGRLKSEGENVNATIEGLVGKNIILKDTLLRASGAGSLLTEQLALGNKAWQENSALTKEAGERYKTFQSQLAILWNQVKDVAITLGNALLPVMKDLLAVATPLVGMIGKLAEAFALLPGPVRTVGLGIVALGAAIGPFLWGFGQIASSVGTVIKAFTAKGIAMSAITALAPSFAAGMTSMAVAARGLAVALGPVAVAITAVWTAWNIGNTETVKNYIAEWGLASENLTARLYRLIVGLDKMTPEQAKAAVAATAAAVAVQQQAKAIDQAGQAAKDFVGPMEASADAVTNFDLRQQEATESTKELAAAAKKAHEARLEQLKAASTLEAKIKAENEQFRGQAIAGIEKEKAALRDYYNWLGERRMEDDARGLPLVSTMVLPWTKFKDAVKADSPALVKSFEGISDAFKNIGNTILAAVQGGGNILSSIGSSLGMGIGKDLSENLFGFLTRNLGKTLGGAFAAVLPGIGALLGPALDLLGQGFKKLFGIGANDEVKKYNAEIDTLRQKLIDTHGTLETLELRANAVGLSFKEAWGHQGQEGLAAFQALMDEFEQRWADNEAAVASLNEELQTTQGALDGLIGKARDLGYEFDESGQFVGVSFETVKAKADEFGVSLDGLGGKFQQQNIDGQAKKVIDAFTLLEKAGGDVGGILVGMKDEIGALVGDSILFGTTVPKNMEPWVKELIRTDQLVDKNGDAITDLSKIKFGDPVKTEFEKISSALLECVTKLNDILGQIAAIPTQKTLVVRAESSDPGPPAGFGDPNKSDGEPGFASGTMGRLGSWFGNFPKSGLATALHGMEAVVTAPQAVPFAMDVLAGLGGGMPAMAGDAGLLYEIQGLRRDLQTTIPALSETAARHGAQTAGRRR